MNRGGKVVNVIYRIYHNVLCSLFKAIYVLKRVAINEAGHHRIVLTNLFCWVPVGILWHLQVGLYNMICADCEMFCAITNSCVNFWYFIGAEVREVRFIGISVFR